MKNWRVRIAAGISLICSSLNQPLWAVAPGVSVSLEVTQGMQYVDDSEGSPNLTNTIELVAGRQTFVRARVKHPQGMKFSSVDAKLDVTPKPGTHPQPPNVSDVLNAEEFKAFLNSDDHEFDRSNVNHTLNFRVKSLAKGSWDFKVKVSLKLQDGTRVEKDKVATLEAVVVRPIKIQFVRVNYREAAARDDLEEAAWFLRACYPLPDAVEIQWEPYPKRLCDEINGTCGGQIDDEKPSGAADAQSEVDTVLAGLEGWLDSSDKLQFVYGWVKAVEQPGEEDLRIADDHCTPILGWSHCKIGFGTAHSQLAAKVLAHEFGHMLDLSHCGHCGDGFTGDCDMEGQVGWNVYQERPTSKNCLSVMICGKPPAHRGVWTTPKQYKHCLDILKEGSNVIPSSGCWAAKPEHDKPSPRMLVVRGRFAKDGESIAWLDYVFRYPWKMHPKPEAANGPYEVVAVDASGLVSSSRKFDPGQRLEYTTDEQPTGTTYGYFSVMVPFPEDKEVETVSIRKGNIELRKVSRSSDPFDLEISAPQPSSTLTDETSIEWNGKADPGVLARLRYQVFYSPDGGESFLPVKLTFMGNKVVFDPKEFPPSSEGRGLVRILVSDGLTTVSKEIEKLSVRSK